MSTFTILNAIVFYRKAGEGSPRNLAELISFVELFADDGNEVVEFVMGLKDAGFWAFENVAPFANVSYNHRLIRQAVKQLGADQEQ